MAKRNPLITKMRQQKVRLKRGYLSRFGAASMSSGKGPNKEAIAQYAAHARGLGLELPKTLGVSPDRLAAMIKAEGLENSCEMARSIVVEDRFSGKTLMFSTPDQSIYFFIRSENGALKRSITYCRARAYLLLEEPEAIRWVSHTYAAPSPSPTSSPP